MNISNKVSLQGGISSQKSTISKLANKKQQQTAGMNKAAKEINEIGKQRRDIDKKGNPGKLDYKG